MKKTAIIVIMCLSVSYFSFSHTASVAPKHTTVATPSGYQGVNKSTLREAQNQFGQTRNIFYSPYYILVQNVSGYISNVVYVLDKRGKYVAFYHTNNGGGVTRQILEGSQMVKINGTTYKFTAQQNGILVTDSANNVSYLVKRGG